MRVWVCKSKDAKIPLSFLPPPPLPSIPLPSPLHLPYPSFSLLCMWDDNDGILQLSGEHRVTVAEGEDGGTVLEGHLS